MAVNTFRLENGKEILSHGIVPKGAGSRSSFPVLTWGNHAVFFSQAEICMRGVLKALAAVELQLPSGLLFSHCIANGVEYKAHALIGSDFVGDNAVVKEVTDDGKVQDTLRCVNVGYVGSPLLIGPLGGEVTVQLAVFPGGGA